MFQFTTTNVINSPWFGGYVTDKEWEIDDPQALFTVGEDKEGNDTFFVKGVNNFVSKNVISVYKAEARPAEYASVTFDLNDITDPLTGEDPKKGDIYRLNIYIGLSQGSNDAMYANDFYFKGKPLMIDFVWVKGDDKNDEAKKVAENLVKTIKRYGLVFEGEKMVHVTLDSDGVITLTAVNEYQRFKKAVIEKLDPTAYQGMGDWNEVEDVATINSEGSESFGTYSYILHNLRIPTSARDSMFAPNVEETPHVGALYNQYTLHYCKNRGSLGLNAVGQQALSHTTHVFYVKQDICKDFEEALTTALGANFEEEKPGTGAITTEGHTIYKLTPKKD